MFVYQQLIGSCDTVKLVIIIETVVSAVFSCGGFELWSWLLLQFVPFRGSAPCVTVVQQERGIRVEKLWLLVPFSF